MKQKTRLEILAARDKARAEMDQALRQVARTVLEGSGLINPDLSPQAFAEALDKGTAALSEGLKGPGRDE